MRQYDPICEYVPASCLSAEESQAVTKDLATNLDGYIGPAYNYDDRKLTEEWMSNFQETSLVLPSAEEIIRMQLDNLMEIMISKVQDQVCNDLKVLSHDPVGLGQRLVERPVWGIDSHTNKMIRLILEDFYWKRGAQVDSLPVPDVYSTDAYTLFLERTLLPAINSVPVEHAHSMSYVFQSILEVLSPSPLCS